MDSCRIFQPRIKRRKFIIIIFLLISGWFLMAVAIEYFDYSNDFKLDLIKQSIKSESNMGACTIPDLPLYNPELMQFYHSVEQLNCGNPDDDWVACKKSICYIKPEAIAVYGEIRCQFTDLIRSTDYKVKYGKTRPFSTESYVLEESDFARAVCKADSKSWTGIAIGIRDTIKIPVENSNYPLFNVFMLGFDSLSRLAFMRKLPKTYNYLTRNLSGSVLTGYNIVGDGTPQAIIPILTGKTELELPETRKRKFKSEFVDVYPFVWNDYKKHGYVTAYNEDLPSTGIFTYRLNGFKKQPTDHYMRTYFVEQENYNHYNPFCISNAPSHQIFLNYSKDFLEKYSENPKFGFSFHGELSHDSINQVEVVDDDLMNFIRNLKDKNILDNTIFILMSDHGNRFASIRDTIQGKQEERLPFFSFVFPESFKAQYPKYYSNFLDNVNKLTTPFDIHETLFDILRIQNLETSLSNNEVQPRAISLFRQIPKNRSCADAFIESHWCSCLDWKPINIHNERLLDESSKLFYQRLSTSILQTINNYTNPYRSLCHELSLKEAIWLMKVQPKRALINFKGNKDQDGYVADLRSSTSQTSTELYQMKVKLSPGNSVFEASVSYNRKKDEFSTNINHISRVNKYGNQMMCIYNKDPELRKFCYCRTQSAE